MGAVNALLAKGADTEARDKLLLEIGRSACQQSAECMF